MQLLSLSTIVYIELILMNFYTGKSDVSLFPLAPEICNQLLGQSGSWGLAKQMDGFLK